MKKLFLTISILNGLTVLSQTIPTSTVTGSLKINDSLSVTNNIQTAGDVSATGNITAIGEVTAQDTLRAQKDIIVDGNAKIAGSLEVKGTSVFTSSVIAKQGFTFDGINGLKYTPATPLSGAIYEIGNVANHLNKTLPFVTCPIPGVPGTVMNLSPFNGVIRAYSLNGLVNATTEMYNTPWNGYGHIEVQGTDQFGDVNNELLINFWCGRNTGINTGPNGGTTYFGNHVEIGFPQQPLRNIALNIRAKSDQTDIIAVSDESNNINFLVKKNGFVFAREINVKSTSFPDYVFNKNYKLAPLEEVSEFIKKNNRLKGFETAKYYEENGIPLSEVIQLQQEKLEEVILYLIELKKEIEILKKQIK